MMGIEVDASEFPTKSQRYDSYKQYAKLNCLELEDYELKFLDRQTLTLIRLEGYYWACWAEHMMRDDTSSLSEKDIKAIDQLHTYKERRILLFSNPELFLNMSK
eukprot:gnl/Chilomastix_caulleri/1847.p1 GENE.gnl/Chilomastix_caulleri/1847~~gnl/Chilomastix_caulleri/1847.p1  ORF type:complete len:104 (+),score=20.07 gnl/Chilomastix_caulleri/1847:59-370(+)